jgi:succinate dehydrogenase/fumarate reductase flavoprotein subunit
MTKKPSLYPTTTANFLCGKKCKNKRERERIENEARQKQLAQEAKMRELELQRQQEQIEAQQALNDLQKQMQDLMIVREQAVVNELAPAEIAQSNISEEPASNSSNKALLVVGILAVIGLTAYYILRK